MGKRTAVSQWSPCIQIWNTCRFLEWHLSSLSPWFPINWGINKGAAGGRGTVSCCQGSHWGEQTQPSLFNWPQSWTPEPVNMDCCGKSQPRKLHHTWASICSDYITWHPQPGKMIKVIHSNAMNRATQILVQQSRAKGSGTLLKACLVWD